MIKKHIEEFTANPMYDGLNSHMKWELLKAEIRAVGQQFSRFIQSNKHNHTTNLRDSLNDLEKQLSNDPSDKYLQNEINKSCGDNASRRDAANQLCNNVKHAQVKATQQYPYNHSRSLRGSKRDVRVNRNYRHENRKG